MKEDMIREFALTMKELIQYKPSKYFNSPCVDIIFGNSVKLEDSTYYKMPIQISRAIPYFVVDAYHQRAVNDLNWKYYATCR